MPLSLASCRSFSITGVLVRVKQWPAPFASVRTPTCSPHTVAPTAVATDALELADAAATVCIRHSSHIVDDGNGGAYVAPRAKCLPTSRHQHSGRRRARPSARKGAPASAAAASAATQKPAAVQKRVVRRRGSRGVEMVRAARLAARQHEWKQAEAAAAQGLVNLTSSTPAAGDSRDTAGGAGASSSRTSPRPEAGDWGAAATPVSDTDSDTTGDSDGSDTDDGASGGGGSDSSNDAAQKANEPSSTVSTDDKVNRSSKSGGDSGTSTTASDGRPTTSHGHAHRLSEALAAAKANNDSSGTNAKTAVKGPQPSASGRAVTVLRRPRTAKARTPSTQLRARRNSHRAERSAFVQNPGGQNQDVIDALSRNGWFVASYVRACVCVCVCVCVFRADVQELLTGRKDSSA